MNYSITRHISHKTNQLKFRFYMLKHVANNPISFQGNCICLKEEISSQSSITVNKEGKLLKKALRLSE